MTRTIAASCHVALMLFIAVRGPATAQEPNGVTNSPRYACPLQVMAVVPMGDGKGGTASRYAIGLEAFTRDPRRVSGTLSLFVGASRYDVPFKDAVAVGATEATVASVVPVVVSFPAADHVDAVTVAALEGPNAGPCDGSGPWVTGDNATRRLSNGPTGELAHAILKSAVPLHAIDVGAPVAISLSCKEPYVEAKLTAPWSPTMPEIAARMGIAGRVIVEVVVAPDGGPATAWVWASPYDELSQPSIAAAKLSRYSAPRLACRNVAGVYMLAVEFAAQ